MRVTRRHLDLKVERINSLLNRPHAPYQTVPGGVEGNVGNFHIDTNSAGNSPTHYVLHEMLNKKGGVALVGNRVFLGASAFDYFLAGILEGIEFSKKQ